LCRGPEQGDVKVLDGIVRMPPGQLLIWAVLALVALGVIVYALVAERRRFAAQGKAGAWTFVRLASLPILAATVAVVLVPSLAVGGPEALAVMYGLLFTAAPLTWFGLHWLAGALTRPRLARAEATGIAIGGLAIVLGPALAANMAAPWVYTLSHSTAGARLQVPPDAPRPLTVASRERFAIAGIGDLWTERWQLAEGVTIEGIQIRVGDTYTPADHPGSHFICRSGREVHMLWHADAPPPAWRLVWSGADGKRAKSDWSDAPPPGPAKPFSINWRSDGFDIPLRLPKGTVSLGFIGANGVENGEGAQNMSADNSDNCMPLEFRRVVTEQRPALTKAFVSFWRVDAQQTLRGTFLRPVSPD